MLKWIISSWILLSGMQALASPEACPAQIEIPGESNRVLIDSLASVQGKMLVASGYQFMIHDSEELGPIHALVSEDFNLRGSAGIRVECADPQMQSLGRLSESFPVVIDVSKQGDKAHSFWYMQVVYDGKKWGLQSKRSRLLSTPDESKKELKNLEKSMRVFGLNNGQYLVEIRRSQGAFTTSLYITYDLI